MSSGAFKNLAKRETMLLRYSVNLDNILPVRVYLDGDILRISSHGENEQQRTGPPSFEREESKKSSGPILQQQLNISSAASQAPNNCSFRKLQLQIDRHDKRGHIDR